MRKVWLCIFYALCIFTIVFSLFWMALPSLPFPADSGEENLLPEADALRLKQGLYVTGETALRALLEDLGE
mgnify:CR=1 FL=1